MAEEVSNSNSPIVWDPETLDRIDELIDFNQDNSITNSQNRLTYHSYSGTDIVASILLPREEKPMILGELQTISYSIHRENKPVRSLGYSNPMGFVKGPRTIAGSLIFTQFNIYAFYRLQYFRRLVNNGLFPLADSLPPFDIVLSFGSEYGSFGSMKIFGVNIVDEGGTMSIEDLVIEQTYTFMARGIQPLMPTVPTGLQNIKFNYDEEGKNSRSVPIIEFG